MLQQALEYLVGIARSGHEPTELDVTAYKKPQATYVIDGSIETVPCEPPPVRCTVTSLDGLKQAVAFYGGDPAETSVWVQFGRVDVVINDGVGQMRTSRIEMRVSSHYSHLVLRDLRDAEPKLSQADCLRMLREDFCDSAFDDSFLPAISNLRFKTEDEAQATASKAQAGMGREIMSLVTNADGVPDQITFSYPSLPSLRSSVDSYASIRCAVILHPEDRQISIRPLPGAIEKAEQDATKAMLEAIVALDLEATLIEGSPGP